jgi:hypothetical protein
MAILFETELDDSQFQAGLKNMEKGGKRVEGSLVGSFSSMAKGIGASMAAAFTVGAVVNAAKALLDFAGELQDQADALGVSTQKLQELQGALANSGVSAEKFTTAMATLSQNVQQAKNDTGTARASFDALGISFESISKDPIDELILKIADGLKNAKDPAAALAAALDLLGTKQIKFAAGLKNGRDEIQSTAATIKTLNDEQVAEIARIGDAWNNAKTSAKAFGIEAILGIKRFLAGGGRGGTNDVYVDDPSMTVGRGMGNAAATGGAVGAVKGAMEKAAADKIPTFPKTEVDPKIRKQIEEAAKEYMQGMRDFQKIGRENYEGVKEQTGKAIEKKNAIDEKEAKEVAQAAKEAAKDVARKNIEKAGQDLQQAQQNTGEAKKRTVDAKSSLERALSGNADRRPNKLERQVKKMMDEIENPKPERDPSKGSSLDDRSQSKSSRRGSGKALEEFKKAKDAEKAARKAEDLIKEQQKDMVEALKKIEKGINGN